MMDTSIFNAKAIRDAMNIAIEDSELNDIEKDLLISAMTADESIDSFIQFCKECPYKTVREVNEKCNDKNTRIVFMPNLHQSILNDESIDIEKTDIDASAISIIGSNILLGHGQKVCDTRALSRCGDALTQGQCIFFF